MKCPFCLHSESKVVDSRETTDLAETRRRRECLDCGERFTTYERLDSVDLAVIKKDGRRETFDRDKLVRGFVKSCEKRPVAREKIEAAVASIEAQLRKGARSEVSSRKIGELVMMQLKKLDQVAYVRFASVYRSFKDISHFEKEIKLLKQET